MDLSTLSNDELFGVLLCGSQPIENATVKDYAEEWNKRCANNTNKDGNGYAVDL